MKVGIEPDKDSKMLQKKYHNLHKKYN